MSDQPLSRYELFLIQLAGQAVNIKYVYLSVVVFLVYHCLINLDDEIKYIWGMKWGFSKCFYIATKYLAFCDGIMALVYLFNTNLQPSTCAVLYPAIIYFVAFGALVAEIIISMRTWIAWGFSRYILWYLTLVVVATTSIILFFSTSPFRGEVALANTWSVPNSHNYELLSDGSKLGSVRRKTVSELRLCHCA